MELAAQVRAIASRAGAAILEVYEGDFDVTRKDDRSPLTAADLAAHHVIVDGLRALTPDIPVLSEEAAGVPWPERSRWTRYWLVDPLDGTREFVKRNGEFTVNIALIDGHRPVLGVVQAPVSGQIAWACSGAGAWQAVGAGEAQRLRTRARVEPLVVAGSRSHGDARQAGLL